MKIRSVGTQLFHVDGRAGQTDRQIDRTKLIAAFGNFANATKHDKFFSRIKPPNINCTIGSRQSALK